MQQDNALRRLEDILEQAIKNGDKGKNASEILLTAMGLDNSPQNLTDFYALVNTAHEEAIKIRNQPKIERYISTIKDLRIALITNHLTATRWETIANHIEQKGVLITLDALANYFYDQNPLFLLGKDFLSRLIDQFEAISNDILSSELPKEFKKFLIDKINDIVQAIRRYHIYGTEGLEKATQAMFADLILKEGDIEPEIKKHSLFTKLVSLASALLIYITPSPYDIVGSIPDLQEYWIPKYEELADKAHRVEPFMQDTSSIQEFLKKAKSTFEEQTQKSIEGSPEPKALPEAKQDSEPIDNNQPPSSNP